MDIYTLLWSLTAGIVSTLYFFLIKYYSLNKDWWFVLIPVSILQLLSIFLYYKSLSNVPTAIPSAIIFVIINAISLILAALFAKNVLNDFNVSDIVGVIMVVIGIILIGERGS